MTQAFTRLVDGLALPGSVDDTLVAAAHADPEAFRHLYDHYLPRVYRYIYSRAPSPEDAADLTQQVFVRAFDSLGRYRPGGFFASWLFRIARNVAIDADRKRRRGATIVDLALVAEPADPSFTEDEYVRKERLQRLSAILLTLDPHKRDLLALRFAAGLTSAEIGSLVGKSESAVKKQLSRIIDSLKEQYRDDLT